MQRVTTLVLAALISFACPAFATEGLISVKSPYTVAETLVRLEAGAEERGLKIFARIDHENRGQVLPFALRRVGCSPDKNCGEVLLFAQTKKARTNPVY